MSDLLPAMKDLSHNEVLSLGSQAMQTADYQLLSLRNRLFRGKEEFVTDRSYADLAAYFGINNLELFRNAKLEHFIGCCKASMEDQCDLAIFLPLKPL